MKIAVIIFPGSNCDHDAYVAFKKILDQPTDFIWHKETDLKAYDLLVLPGGFSYGDYLRCGAIAKFSPVMKEVVSLAGKGTKVIGICNGFQILTESGLLPGALMMNRERQFICRDINLRVENNATQYSHLCDINQVLTIPIAHSEGNYYCSQEEIEAIEENNQVVFRYCDQNGEISNDSNPNGSLNNIAGVINREGNVLGMMPHPERNAENIIGNADGRLILSSIIHSIKEN